MRRACISVFNNQQIELYNQLRGSVYDGFEVWMVGRIAKERTVLMHFTTQANLEGRLCYAKPGDLIWNDVEETEIPSRKSPSAIELEATIARGKHLDHDLASWCFNGILQLKLDRKACNAARRELTGEWSDGIASLIFHPDGHLDLSCPKAPSHPLYAAVVQQADSWSFGSWRLFLMNGEAKRGERMTVLHCDEHELHLSGQRTDSLAHVFKRALKRVVE